MGGGAFNKNDSINDIVARYDSAIAYDDYLIGKVVQTLKEEKLLDNTIIFFFSDHGESLYEHGIYFDHHGLYDVSSNIPLIMCGKGIPKNKKIEGFVQHEDFAPTILDFVGIDYDDSIFDGKSLFPLFKKDKKIRDFIFMEEGDNLTQRHLGFLDKVNDIKKEKNFFLYLHYSNIHTGVMLNVLKKYDNFNKEYFKKKDENLKAYDGYVEAADKYLGTILNKIKEFGMSEDTIVVVISDHGISVGEKFGERAYGGFCYDYTLKAFTLFFQPSIFPKKEIKQLVRTVDTLPTILDFLGIDESQAHEKMDGKSMRPLIQGKEDERYAFIEAGNPLESKEPPKQPNVRAIRTSKWKFIHNYWNDSEELYDLEQDPQENNNLIETKKEIAEDLRKKLNLELRKALSLKIKTLKKQF